MIIRIPQRVKEDCVVCAVAMVMGHPYNYERVLRDSANYPAITGDGSFLAWWEGYLRDEGFQITYRRFLDLYELPRFRGSIVGLLHMNIPRLRAGHVVAVDELGIVDPADGAKDHIVIQDYIYSRLEDGFVFDKEFLAICKYSEASC
jgi:hypothetical protein